MQQLRVNFPKGTPFELIQSATTPMVMEFGVMSNATTGQDCPHLTISTENVLDNNKLRLIAEWLRDYSTKDVQFVIDGLVVFDTAKDLG